MFFFNGSIISQVHEVNTFDILFVLSIVLILFESFIIIFKKLLN